MPRRKRPSGVSGSPGRSAARGVPSWASQPATPGEKASPEQVAAIRRNSALRAYAGDNPGTAASRALNRSEYLARLEKRPGLGARRAAGRPGVEVTSESAIFREVGFVLVENPTRAQRRRLSRYESLTGALRNGAVSPLAFEARIGGWLAYADGLHFESDPDRVLAILAERAAAGLDLFIYSKDEES